MALDRRRIHFVKSATKPSQFPPEPLPHLAVAGRSNVGKSSLINTLFERKKLAKVSQTPGATRLINFFEVDESFFLVDLPGYGYAKRSKAEREDWREMVRAYLDSEASPAAMLVLMDLRRGPEEDEQLLFESLAETGIAGIGVLTKADKLAKSKRKVAAMAIRKRLSRYTVPLLLFSSKTGQGKDELWRAIERTLGFSNDSGTT